MTQLQTEIDKLKAGFARLKTVWIIAFGVAFIVLVLLLFTVFKGKNDNPKIDALQQQLEAEKARVKVLEEKLPLYDSLLAMQQRQLEGNKTTEKQIIVRYEKIPVNTPTDKSGIRREFADY